MGTQSYLSFHILNKFACPFSMFLSVDGESFLFIHIISVLCTISWIRFAKSNMPELFVTFLRAVCRCGVSMSDPKPWWRESGYVYVSTARETLQTEANTPHQVVTCCNLHSPWPNSLQQWLQSQCCWHCALLFPHTALPAACCTVRSIEQSVLWCDSFKVIKVHVLSSVTWRSSRLMWQRCDLIIHQVIYDSP